MRTLSDDSIFGNTKVRLSFLLISILKKTRGIAFVCSDWQECKTLSLTESSKSLSKLKKIKAIRDPFALLRKKKNGDPWAVKY